jgi:hypothetical protein
MRRGAGWLSAGKTIIGPAMQGKADRGSFFLPVTLWSRVGGGNPAGVLEWFGTESDAKQPGTVIYTRTLEIGPSSKGLLARLAPATVAVAIVGHERVSLVNNLDFTLQRIPATKTPVRVQVLMAKGQADALDKFAKTSSAPRALKPLTEGGPKRRPEILKTAATLGKNDGPFAVDTFALPENNPWNAQLRLTVRLLGRRAGGRLLVGRRRLDGVRIRQPGLTWQRIASGLFQPLGLKLRDGNIYICCRDQIVRLHDTNGDGETDYSECFNNDHQVTEHFHEFAMGLQTDAEGNFYYAKSGRHALPALVPHHGTLLKVNKDGATTEILATGFRAANGVCLHPDGTFFVTDQEGFWTCCMNYFGLRRRPVAERLFPDAQADEEAEWNASRAAVGGGALGEAPAGQGATRGV